MKAGWPLMAWSYKVSWKLVSCFNIY